MLIRNVAGDLDVHAVGLLLVAGLHACGSVAEPDFAWNLPDGELAPEVPSDGVQTAQAVELGRHLFYDLRFSLNGDRACGTCHEQARGFTDGFFRAVGTTGELHGHNTPTLTNVGYREPRGWASPDATTLELQPATPLLGQHPVEMGMFGREADVLDVLRTDPYYASAFREVFPDAQSPHSLDTMFVSLAAFERTLIERDSPFDRHRRGEAALGEDATRGYALFVSDRLRCDRCHGGLDFDEREGATTSDGRGFANLGLYDLDGEGSYPATAPGLVEYTGLPVDRGRFRAPTLRNLSTTGPYMHDGSVTTVRRAIEVHLDGGRLLESGPFAGDGRANPYVDPDLTITSLTADELDDLEAFLRTLDGDLSTRVSLSNPWISP